MDITSVISLQVSNLLQAVTSGTSQSSRLIVERKHPGPFVLTAKRTLHNGRDCIHVFSNDSDMLGFPPSLDLLEEIHRVGSLAESITNTLSALISNETIGEIVVIVKTVQLAKQLD